MRPKGFCIRHFGSDIGPMAHLRHLIFNLHIRTYVLSFPSTILGFSCSHCQYGIKAITLLLLLPSLGVTIVILDASSPTTLA